VLFAAVFANSPPIRPGALEFPSDFCPANAGFIALAQGSGNSSLFGEFTWSERYCTVPPGRLVPHRDGRPGRLRLRSADGSRRRKHTADVVVNNGRWSEQVFMSRACTPSHEHFFDQREAGDRCNHHPNSSSSRGGCTPAFRMRTSRCEHQDVGWVADRPHLRVGDTDVECRQTSV